MHVCVYMHYNVYLYVAIHGWKWTAWYNAIEGATLHWIHMGKESVSIN